MNTLTDRELDLILELTDVTVEPCTYFDGPAMVSAWKAYAGRRGMHGGVMTFSATYSTKSGAVTGLLLFIKAQPL